MYMYSYCTSSLIHTRRTANYIVIVSIESVVVS